MARVLLIGIGNELRGDDGAGIAAVRMLRAAAEADGIEVLEEQGDVTALLDAWAGCDGVVLVDTMRSGAPPGTLLRLDASEEPLPERLRGSSSTHLVGLAETIELARALDRLPARVVLHAVEGRGFAAGVDLGADVRSGLAALAAAALAEARGMAGAPRAT